MNKITSKKNISFLPELLSFLIPMIVLAAVYFRFGIFPTGEITPLILDLRMEQLPFYNYINNLSSGFNSITYQSLGGLGGGVIDSIQMCCGPAILVFRFFDISSLPWVVWGMILFLIGLCGMSEYIYLTNGFPNNKSWFLSTILSVSYALMSCMIVYTIVPMWIWGGVLLPVIALGVDKIIDNKKYFLFGLVFAFSILANYYMSYILAFFSALYFVYRLIVYKVSLKRFVHMAFNCLICGALSALLVSFSWMPVLFDLMSGKGVESRSINLGIIRNPFKVLGQFLPFAYEGLEKHSMPFIYCGFLTLILVVVYFVDRKNKLREKILSLVFITVLYLCFIFGFLDIAWMFFAEPNGYPSRYSFVFAFVLLMLAGKYKPISFLNNKIILNHALKIILFFTVCFDLYYNSIYLIRSIDEDVGPYAGYEEYARVTGTMDTIISDYAISDASGRTVKNWRYTNDDGVFFGYPDLDYFSSSYNPGLHDFLTDLGLNGQFHLVRSTGLTPPIASILNVEYLIQYGNTFGDYYSYLGSVDGLDIYHNDLCVPTAFAINADMDDGVEEFGDNPFENINLMFEDFCETGDLFDELPVNYNSDTFTVIHDNEHELWMYAKPAYSASYDIHTENSDAYCVFYDGTPIGEYANSVSPFLVELGNGGGEMEFRFDKRASVYDVYMAAYNHEKTIEAVNLIKSNSAYDMYSSKKGMIFSIDLDKPQNVLITIPYTNGYNVYVDGNKSDYSSYRNALVTIKMNEGHHDVLITYSAPGLNIGLAISTVTIFIICSAFVMKEYKKKYEER